MSQGEGAYFYGRRRRIGLTLYAGVGMMVFAVGCGVFVAFLQSLVIDKSVGWVQTGLVAVLAAFFIASAWFVLLPLFCRHHTRLSGLPGPLKIRPLTRRICNDSSLLTLFVGITLTSGLIASFIIKWFGYPYFLALQAVVFMNLVSAYQLAHAVAAIWARADGALPQQREGAT